jgi:hypothetical protein
MVVVDPPCPFVAVVCEVDAPCGVDPHAESASTTTDKVATWTLANRGGTNLDGENHDDDRRAALPGSARLTPS